MKSRAVRTEKGRGDAEVAAVRTKRETPRLGRRGAGQTRGKRDAEVAGKTTSVRQQVWGRGKDRRAAPCGHFATLVRSTFGLRGYPSLRFGASAPGV